MYLNGRFNILRRNYIPPTVTGCLVFSVFTCALFYFADTGFEFDMRFRDLLLLVFFSTVGLSAWLSQMASGGKKLALMVLVAVVFLVVQNNIGVGFAYLLEIPPGYGLMASSVSLAARLARAREVGLVFATLGVVSGGMQGGPVACPRRNRTSR